ncbi:hypothetical protein ACGF5T_30970, partial [Streptomyces sp. NPDC047853]
VRNKISTHPATLPSEITERKTCDSTHSETISKAVVTGESGDGAAFQVREAHGVGLVGPDGGAASALGLGGAQSVVGQLTLEVALEVAGGGEGPHHELHGGQQLRCPGGGR